MSSPKTKEELYCEHYKNHPLLIHRPERREIALESWTSKGPSIRHQYYSTTDELSESLVVQRNISAVFASAAYYQDPQVKTTSKKGYMGGDLIFDIDLYLSGSRYDWMYSACDSTLDLVKVLTQELGIPESNLVIDFSGSKGFHITVEGDEFKNLTKEERRHILQYVRGDKVTADSLGTERGGWSDRFNDYKRRIGEACVNDTKVNQTILETFFQIPKTHTKKLGDILSDASVRKTLKEHRLELDAKIEKSLRKLFLRSERAKFACVDEKVTGDRYRVFRVPGSIHPKTGFASVRVLLEDLSNPDMIFQKVKSSGGTDQVLVTLTEAKEENSDHIKIWEPGTHEIPRWLALHLLSVDN